MTDNVEAFDTWIRGSFADMNTELEQMYFAQDDKAAIEGTGDPVKVQILEQGRTLISALLKEGNTDQGFEKGFNLLGNVGLYMAACRRHEMTEPSREETSPLVEASALSLQLGPTLGVVPRFATSHLSTNNPAKDGSYKSFTTLPDEFLFLEYNTRGVLAFKRAADAIVRTLPLGVSHPVTFTLLEDARDALLDVIKFNDVLFEKLDVDRFFYSVRPYYKPYKVGRNEYRGANAGDFAGINELDLLLGFCVAQDPYYAHILVDKMLYMMPRDQERLKDCMRWQSLLNQFLDYIESSRSKDWFQKNACAFLEVCDAHSRTAAQHHDQLVTKYIDQPAAELPEERLENITASGPPLKVLLKSLEKLRDLRLAADRGDIPTRYEDFKRLREAAGYHTANSR
jgi:hypothetical protein